ncbi:IS1478 transposase [Xanthomonas fragariae]|uniref:IS1478 transposase n=1 Tax=Xanthomonas fragariae TaxID=48664 RepID=A0A1Y6H0Z3_9XANT|nr:hypothetical protein BER92_00580 [Xanthomonas fragariae]AOD16900.1 hypothetical protein BER93_00575 [Xanthomonas fragariae]SMQ97178.1 IS1478 transposase [Xanthomonas fragariae]SMR01120.1 hypothetical protein PD885_03901 [Xanthomonas fragariae]SMR01439.1 IS1478 transposase [Xanthomonas fragariae]
MLGRVVRDLARKLDQVDTGVRERIAVRLQRAQQVLAQRPKDKRQLDALHAPEEAKTLTRRQWRWIKRRQAVEPAIGHLDCRLRRCRRKSAQGDALHVLGCAGGYNLCWPMRWTAFFAGLDPGDGMAILEHRLPITADD